MFVERVDGNSVSEVTQEQNVFGKFLNDNSTGKHADHAQVDINSLDLSSINDCQKKKKKKKKRARKKRKLSACLISSLGSTEEGALSSALVVHDSSVRDISSSNLVRAGDGSSVLAAGEISQEKASGECPNGEPLSGKKKKKSKRNKKRKLTACPLTSLGSTEEGASPTVLVVPDSSVGEVSLNQLDKVFATEEGALSSALVVHDSSVRDISSSNLVRAGDGSSVLAAGEISQEKASGECPNGEPLSGKKKKKSKRNKKRKLTACPLTSLGSTEEGASPTVLVVPDSSVGEVSLNQLDKVLASCDSVKLMEVVVVGNGTSVLAGGKISQDISSGECPNGESEFLEKKEIPKMDNMEENNPVHGRIHGRKKRKSSVCCRSSLESSKDGSVQESSAGYTCLNHLDEAPEPSYSGKMMDEVVVGNGTSVLAGGKISQDISSGECPNGESEFLEKKEIPKMGNLEENNPVHGRIHRRKKRKSSVCCRSSLESSKDGSVQENSAGYTCLNHLDKAPEPSYSGKMMDEVVAGLGISEVKASGECLDGEPASGNERKKFKMENLEESNTGNSGVMDVSLVDMPQTDVEQCNHDKLDVIRNTVLSEENKAAADALGSVPCVDKIEVDNLDIRPVLNDVIPSSSNLVGITDGVSLESPQWSQGGAPLEKLRKKLLVLDVNGLLADIVPTVTGRYKPHKVLAQKAVFKRPFCDDFLQFCFDRFHVGVWSSRNRKNVNSVLDFLMGSSKSNLLFCWDQSHCTKTGYNTVENREKPLLLKELKYLWEKNEPDVPWASGVYNESNTLLLDDSPYKALRNPPNTAVFPHSYCYTDRRDNALGPGGDLRVYLEGLVLADNVQKYVEQNPFGQRPITNMNLSWSFYLKIIGNSSSEEGEDATNDPSACQQLEEDATNDSSACQQEGEDATNDPSACQRPEKDATNYTSACQQGS